jgi:hypothetical protein
MKEHGRWCNDLWLLFWKRLLRVLNVLSRIQPKMWIWKLLRISAAMGHSTQEGAIFKREIVHKNMLFHVPSVVCGPRWAGMAVLSFQSVLNEGTWTPSASRPAEWRSLPCLIDCEYNWSIVTKRFSPISRWLPNFESTQEFCLTVLVTSNYLKPISAISQIRWSTRYFWVY